MKHKRVIIFIAAAFLIPIMVFGGIPEKTVKIKKTGESKPAVSYNHRGHPSVSDCKGCHSAVKDKISAHKKCRVCHENKGGPTKCSLCHKG